MLPSRLGGPLWSVLGVLLRWWKQLWLAAALLVGILMFVYSCGSGLSLTPRSGSGPSLGPALGPALGPDNTSSAEEALRDQEASAFLVPRPRSFRLLLDEPERCQQGAPFLVIVVPVAPGDRTSRAAVRDSWGALRSAAERDVQLYFLLGSVAAGNQTATQEQLVQESRLHHDLIQGDFVDSYGNLTLKTMLMFQWLSSHCPGSAYALKVDSDVFLNVPKLLELLSAAPRRSYLAGSIQRHTRVLRDPSSKWFLPRSVFPEERYPPYALGLGYVFSMDLPEQMAEASAHVRAVYIEDVYVGLCLQELGVTPRNERLFRAWMPFLMPHCYLVNIITLILEDSEQLLETWRTYQKQLGYC